MYRHRLTIVLTSLVMAGFLGLDAQDAVGSGRKRTPPTVLMTSAASNPTNISPIAVTVTFSEPVTGFDNTDISSTGTKSNFAGSGAVYTFDITPLGEGPVTADIGAGVAINGGSEGNTAAPQFSRTYDSIAPTVTINQAAAQADPTNASPVNFTVVFNESVTGFSSTGVSTTGSTATIGTITVTGSGTTYNVEIAATGNGTVVASVTVGAIQDPAGNNNAASTSTDNTVTLDTTAPTVTINQAAAQADPTNASPVNFTVVFSESVTGFSSTGVSTSGSTATIGLITVTGSGDTYNVAIAATGNGTVIASVSVGAIQDPAGNNNAASTSTDNTVTLDTTDPTVTINQAAAQPDPTNASPVNFTVIFSESVTGFGSAGVSTTGSTATIGLITVTGSGTTYNVAIAATGNGTVIASVVVSAAQDAAGNNCTASTSTDNTVTLDTTDPTVTINQAAAQPDPTNASPVNFTVVFNESVTGFSSAGVSTTGSTATIGLITVTGSGTTYNVAIVATGNGTVIASVVVSAAQDTAGNNSAVSTSTDNTVTLDTTNPTVTINQAAAQADPTNASPVNFTVVFSESVTGFGSAGVSTTGSTATIGLITVTGSGTTYNVAIAATGNGTVIASVVVSAAQDAAGNNNAVSTSTDNTVTLDTTSPTVTINQAAAQADPTNGSSVNFTVVFSESVTGFGSGDVSTAGSTATIGLITVTGSGTMYDVAIAVTGNGSVIASVVVSAAQDAAGNNSAISTSTDNTVTLDTTDPTVTINQAAAQTDPTNASPVNFTVVFNESVTGFGSGDVSTTGSTATIGLITVTGSGTTYNVAVAATGNGTVIASVVVSAAQDAAGNNSAVSTSTDNTVTLDTIGPTVAIDQAAAQADPTNASPVNFTVVFNESVTGFSAAGVSTTGSTATIGLITVTGSGTTYNVAIAATGNGTVIASVSVGAIQDPAGNNSAASTSTDNTVTLDTTGPTVTINQAAAQADPTNASPVNFTVVFNESVTGFSSAGVSTTGSTATIGLITVTGSGTTYNVAIAATGNGTVIASVTVGAAQDTAGNGNAASTSTDNTVTFDTTDPTVTINQAAAQPDPTNASPVNFTVVFNESVTGFSSAGVSTAGSTATIGLITVTGSGTTYNVAIAATGNGTVIASVVVSAAQDTAGNNSAVSTSTDNTVTLDTTNPTVTINQAAAQVDPTNASPVNFTVVFSESMIFFSPAGISTAGSTATIGLITVTGSGTTYNVAIAATGNGTVIASVTASAAQDAAGNGNSASTSTDNTVTLDTTNPTVTINQAAAQPDPTNASPVDFTVVFSESVTGFGSAGVSTTGSTATIGLITVTGSGTTYNVAIAATGNGTVIASVTAGAAQDTAGNGNAASTSTDNTVTLDTTDPTVTINQAAAQADPTNASPVNFTVIFSESVTGFSSAGVSTAGSTATIGLITVTGSGTSYNVAIAVTGNGAVIASISAGAAQDTAGNSSAVSTSTDNTVTLDTTDPTVTINQAAAQVDPTNVSPVNFTVVFNESVTGLSSAGVSTTGSTATIGLITVTGSGTTYNVAIAATGNGTVIASVTAGAAQDAAGNGNSASTSTDNTVTLDTTNPTVTINQAAAQADPTNASPVDFTVVFSESVTGFGSAGVSTTGSTATIGLITVTGSGTTYNVAIAATGNGTVIASVTAGAAQDTAGNGNAASTSTDNTVTLDTTDPTVTINQAAAQADPTNASPVNFTVIFSESVTGFSSAGVSTAGSTATIGLITVTGSGTTYNVAIAATGNGTVIASVVVSAAQDAAGNNSAVSTSTDNTVTLDTTNPTVTIDQAAAQVDPTNASPVNFTVVFSESVTGFVSAGVSTTGSTATIGLITVTGSGTSYNVAIVVTGNGAVIASVSAGSAQDTAGNGNLASTSTDNTVTLDTIGPAAGTVNDGVAADIDFQSNFATINANWSGFSDAGGTGIVKYEWAIGTTSGGTQVQAYTDVVLATSGSLSTPLLNGVTYYVSVRATDAAGNVGAIATSDGVLVDNVNPVVNTTNDGVAADIDFQASTTTINANWTASDAGAPATGSGVASYQWAIGTTSGGVDVQAFTAAGITGTSATAAVGLSNGTTYYVTIRAFDNAGNQSSDLSSDGVFADSAGPSAGTVNDGSAADVDLQNSGTTIQANWSGFSDSGSGIQKYEWAIGTTSGGTEAQAYTDVAPLLGTSASATLALVSGTTYFVSVRATDNVGNVSTVATSDGVLVDSIAPVAGTVLDGSPPPDIAFQVNTTTINANWSGFTDIGGSGIVQYEWAIGTTSGGTQTQAYVSVGLFPNASNGTLTLANGTTYFVSVRATDLAGNVSAVATSNGVLVDTVIPVVNTLNDGPGVDIDFQASTTTIQANWTGSDAGAPATGSGIASYQWAIGTFPGGTNTQAFTSVGTATSASNAGLTLTTSVTYYVTVRAFDNAGNQSADLISDGVFVDGTPPSVGSVSDGTGLDVDFQTSLTTIQANWAGFSDASSGIQKYEWAIGTTAGGTQVQAYTDVAPLLGTSASATVTLANGTTYYVSVRATDNTGNVSISSISDGVYVDGANPVAGTVNDGAAADVDFQASTTTIQANWSGFSDAHSGIQQFEWAIGITAGGTTIQAYTGVALATSASNATLTLTNGQIYYVSVRATDFAGNFITATSDGVTVDTAAPTGGSVNDGAGVDIDIQASTTTMSANWSGFTDPLSGIASYEWGIGLNADLTPTVVGYVSVGLGTSGINSSLTLTSGTTYKVFVRAIDNVGNIGTAATSDGVLVDATPPAAPPIPDLATASDSGASSIDDITNDNTPLLQGTAEADSSVKVYAGVTLIGTVSANGSGNWSFIPPSPLADAVHSVTATATDAAGNTSAASPALALTIDTAMPAVPSAPDLIVASDSGISNTDNITSDATPTLDGTSEANATIQILDGVTSLGTTTANGAGAWSFTTAVLSAGLHSFTARATDVAGNANPTASSALAVTIDTIAAAPSTPDLDATSDTGTSNTDNNTNDTTPTLNGTAEPNAAVELFENAISLGTTSADGSGNWIFTTAALPAGVKSFTARQTDTAGNISVVSGALAVTIDLAAAAPGALDLDAASDTGSSSTDNLTKDNTPLLTGSGADPGATVELYSSTTLITTTTADGSGNWTITTPVIGDGSHDFTVKQIDLAGNLSAPSPNLAVVIDTVAPLAPAAPDLQAASDTGSSSTDNITNDNTPTLDGTAEAGSTVALFSDVAGQVGTATANGGTWTITASTLADGAHILTVTATDPAGNESAVSLGLTVTIDTVSAAPTTPDLDVASDSGTSATDNITNDNTPTFNGTSEANAGVQLFDGVTSLGTTTANGSGNWTFTSAVLADAIHSITAVATDAAGTVSTASGALSVTIDTGIPAAPSTPDLNAASDTGASNTDNVTGDTTPTFDGTAEAGATVTVSSSVSGTLGTTVAAGGIWSFTSGILSIGLHDISATSTDVAGNVSVASSSLPVTIDASVPSAPSTPDLIDASDSGASSSDNLTNDNTPTFSGAADPTMTIELFDGVTSLGTTTSDVTGNWSFTAAALTDGLLLIRARATNGSGGQSPFSATLSVTLDTTAPAAPPTPDLNAASDSGTSNTDDVTSDTTPTLDGTAEANAVITVFDGVTSLGTTTANGTGNWSFTTAVLPAGVHVFTATALDAAGNLGIASTALTVTIDTAIATPAAPDLDAASDTGISNTDDFTQDTTPTLSGTAEANSSIQIFDGATSLGTTTASGAGAWTFTTGALPDAAHSFTVVATDSAGNISAASPGLTVNIDNTAVAPSAPDLATASDSGSSTTDDLTNVTAPQLDGTGAEAGATVQLFDSTTLIGTTTASGTGTWSFTPTLANGLHVLTVRQTDLAGNLSAGSVSLSVIIDAVAPLAPSTPDLDVTSDSGSSGTDNLTNDTTPTFNGTAEANSTVELFDGVTSIGTGAANGSGNWTITSSTLTSGVHAITATAQDAAGNTGVASSPLSVTIDTVSATPSTPDLDVTSDSGISGTDDITNDTTPTFNGTSEPNSSVQLFDGVTSLGTTTANGSGNWTFTSGTLAAAIHSITAVATDVAGNISTASGALSVTIDTVSATPSTPDLDVTSDSGISGTDNITNDTTPTFNGPSEPNSSVQLFDGVTSLGTTTANGSGNWTFTSGTLTDGVHLITAVATDVAGNISTASGALSVTIDTVSATPSTPDLDVTSDSGSSGTDDITNDTTPTFNGTSEPNSSVQLFDGVTSLGTTTANGSGNWTFTSGTLTDGVHLITAVATDVAGNISTASGALSVTIDTVSATPSTPDLDVTSDSGISGTDDNTSDTTPTFNGTSEPNSSVQLFDGVTSLGTTTANGSGNWTFTSGTLTDGVHLITAVSTDVAGNISTASGALSVTIDTVSATPSTPDLDVTSDSGSSGTDDITNDTTPTFNGTSEPNSSVQLFDGVTSLGTTTANGSGNWTFTSGTLTDGVHLITAVATDVAGNISTASGALSVTIDTVSTTPSTPDLDVTSDSGISGTDDNTSDTTPTFNGTSEPNSSVQLFDGVTSLGTTTANGSGNWTFTSGTLTDGVHSITAVATDVAGNVSAASGALSVTIDTVGATPSTPDLAAASDTGSSSTDNLTNDSTPTLNGTSEPNSSVQLFDGVTSLGTTTADGTGNWTFTTAALADGVHSFTAIATDVAGNVSSASAALSVTLDLTLPTAGTVNDGTGADINNQQTATISANWSGFADNLGVDSYEWAVGTSPGATDIMAFTSVGLATSASASGLPVLPAVIYYVTVRANDAAGNTITASSDGVIIDNNPPAAPTSLGQYRTAGAGIMTGGATNETVVQFRAQTSDADAGQALRLEVEVQVVGVSFTGTPTATGAAGPAGLNSVQVTGLAAGSYHWQVRAVDSFNSPSIWQSYGSNADPSDVDFTVVLLANAAPGTPTALGQFVSTGASPIGVGGTTGESTVVFKVTGTDPDGDTLRLEIEILPTGAAFTGTPTHTGSFVPSGSALQATAIGLADGAYHWQARLVDAAGASSAWAVFGGNIDPSDADVNVFTATNSAPAMPTPTQHADSGLPSAAAGLLDPDGRLAFRAALSDVDASQTLRLEVELKSTSVPFDNAATAVSAWVAGNQTAEVVIEGLASENYHWQARVRDSAGALSAWVSFGGNLETETDFTVVSAPPGTSSLGALEQLEADNATPILEGGITLQGGVTFRGMITNPSGGAIRLQVEVRSTAAFFTGIPTVESGLLPSGATATILLTGLLDGSYQWRARAADTIGSASPWVSFGAAPDGSIDFTVNAAANTTPGVAALNQATLSNTPLAVGASTFEGSIRLQASVTDVDAGQLVRLIVEVKQVGVAFDGTPNGASAFVVSGSAAEVVVSGLVTGVAYHWQAWAQDSAGSFSPTAVFGGNADPNATDFLKAASSGAPAAPTELAQLVLDGSLVIPLGGATPEMGARFQARSIDLDGGDLRLEVEVQPIGTTFTDSPSATGGWTTSGGLANVTVTGLANPIGYHWQVRAVNSSGLASAWIRFGGNLETEADFIADISAPAIGITTPPSTKRAGFCGSVGIDLLLPVGFLWLLSRRRRGK